MRREWAKIRGVFIALSLVLMTLLAQGRVGAAPLWATKLDGGVRHYQATDFGLVLAGTERSLYALDGQTGEIFWRYREARLGPTDVALVPGTDLLLLHLEKSRHARVEALDLFSGLPLWESEKVRGQIMQMAVELDAGLLAIVTTREARGKARENFKRRPVVRVLELETGRELWKRDLESEVEMMPERWGTDEEVDYTLDNYRPPVFLDNRLYLFYEGVTSFEAATGRERERERFRVNEEGLALTEADAVAGEQFLYASGRGRVRAVDRETSELRWEAKDLGLTPELVLSGGVLYARTGGQFTRLADGETEQKGPYGVSALDARTGKILWRYKGADKGITNLALYDPATLLVADRDDLLVIEAATGKRRARWRHEVERAAFVLINERGEAVVGGQNEVAGFDPATGRNLWRARHTPPGRGVLRTAAAIAARAAALYFRYGGAATTAFRGVQVARTLGALNWSGLAATRAALPGLTTLASNYSRQYATSRFRAYGLAARLERGGPRVALPAAPRRPSLDVQDRVLDRLDPARQLDRLSEFLLRRRRLAALRGEWIYFYTELDSGGRGLAGVSLNTGATGREIRLGSLDERFVVDEVGGLLYTADDNRLLAYGVR